MVCVKDFDARYNVIRSAASKCHIWSMGMPSLIWRRELWELSHIGVWNPPMVIVANLGRGLIINYNDIR